MPKSFTSLLAATAVAGGLSLGAVPSADAAASGVTAGHRAVHTTAGCVDRQEFRRARRGMTVRQVARVFKTRGTRGAISHGGGFTYEIRDYDACTRYGAVSVGFANGKLDSKTAVW